MPSQVYDTVAIGTKGEIYSSGDFYLSEDCFDENKVYIQAEGLGNAEVNLVDKHLNVTIAIPNEIMDELAIEWCKKRKLNAHSMQS